MVIQELQTFRLVVSRLEWLNPRFTIQRKGRFFWRNVVSSDDLKASLWVMLRLQWPRPAPCGS